MKWIDITPDEQRQLEQQRAAAAIETRPINQVDAIQKVFVAMRALALIGKNLDPNDCLWDRLIQSIPETPV